VPTAEGGLAMGQNEGSRRPRAQGTPVTKTTENTWEMGVWRTLLLKRNPKKQTLINTTLYRQFCEEEIVLTLEMFQDVTKSMKTLKI
jgi:hypothetical protein